MSTDVLQQLRKIKVFTIDTLGKLLRCSIRTSWRRLREWNAYTSYNHNAKYHALTSIPRFDSNGIWRHKGICFSKHGNLTQTIAHLVAESPEGISAQNLCSILGVTAKPLYAYFHSIKEIAPQRIGRALVFFSSNSDICSRQMERHTSRLRLDQLTMPRSTDAVLILVDRIKHPDDSIERCARRLRKQSATITPEAINALLAQYGIGKKTADFP
jgi:hypothetical protein